MKKFKNCLDCVVQVLVAIRQLGPSTRLGIHVASAQVQVSNVFGEIERLTQTYGAVFVKTQGRAGGMVVLNTPRITDTT